MYIHILLTKIKSQTTNKKCLLLLQGAEGAGGGTAQQPAGEPHAVQQAPQAGQHRQPGQSHTRIHRPTASRLLSHFQKLLV